MSLVQHDGRGRPDGKIDRINLRGALRHGEAARWDWAGKPHQPCDVVSYELAEAPGPMVDGVRWFAECLGAALSGQAAMAARRLNRTDVLDAARQAVTVDRAATHGGVEDSFNRIAAIWSVHLGVTVTGAQVSLMLAELKVVRAWGNPTHADNWCDLAGYAACGGELSGATA